MTKKKNNVLAALAILALVPACSGESEPGEKRLFVLYTNDLHSHLNGTGPSADFTPGTTGDDDTLGGYARITTLIKDVRKEAGADPVLVLDAGDFSMGTLFSTLAFKKAADLAVMKHMGYDAAGLGNHEFEWGPAALASMLKAAAAAGGLMPLLPANTVFSGESDADDELEALENSKAVPRTAVFTPAGGLKVGLFALMGKGAAFVAPAAAPVTFADQVEAAAASVAELKKQGADLVICLSHSGVDLSLNNSEDHTLAAQVEGIDLIVSGHTHTLVEEPLVSGNTIIVQAGEYGQHVGKLVLKIARDKVEIKSYKMLKVDDSTAGEADLTAEIEGYIRDVDAETLRPEGLSYDDALAETDFDLTMEEMKESALANLITDASRSALSAIYPDDPVAFYFDSGGVIRDNIMKGGTGEIRVADAFNALPLGTGPDGKPGYPLVDFYVTAQEAAVAAEITATVSYIKGNDFFIHPSGMRIEYDPEGMMFHRVKAVYQCDAAGECSDTALDTSETNTALYHVGTNIYVAGFLGGLGELTGGLFSITAKKADGSQIEDISSCVADADPESAGIQEIKQWRALMDFLKSFPDGDSDGLPDVPDSYSKTGSRIVTVD